MKRKLLKILTIITAVSTIVLIVMDINPAPALAAGLLAMFLIYSLWDAPPRHKVFSYKDIKEAADMVYGRLWIPDWSVFGDKPGNNRKSKKRREKSGQD